MGPDPSTRWRLDGVGLLARAVLLLVAGASAAVGVGALLAAAAGNGDSSRAAASRSASALLISAVFVLLVWRVTWRRRVPAHRPGAREEAG